MKSQIQAPNWRRWSWYLRGSKLFNICLVLLFKLLNLLLSDAVISLFTCFFSLKCYVGTVHVLYDSIFNNVLGNLALRIFVFFSLLLVWRVNTWSCWISAAWAPFPGWESLSGSLFHKGMDRLLFFWTV